MLLQFREPTREGYREKISEKGVKFISYIPENAWLVKVDAKRSEIVSEKKVKFLGPYRPGYRISPSLSKQMQKNSGQVQIRIEMFTGDKETLSKHGSLKGKFGPKTWKLKTEYTQIPDIAREKHVKWIAPKAPEPQTLNDKSRKLIDVNRLQSAPYNLRGKGFTAAIWDSGWAGKHEDLNYTLSWTGGNKTIIGDSGDCSSNCIKYHGTHVAGTMAGGGNLTNKYRGMAPDSRIITYEWPDYFEGYGQEIFSETKEASNTYDSVLSQNSWGYAVNDSDSNSNNNHEIMGNYDKVAEYYDNITANESIVQPLSIVFSAGNEGNNVNTSTNQWDSRYNTTLGPGGTAKNTITVGAVDDSGDMTSYSSWGPTDDGRIKPTVVADGGSSQGGIKSTFPSIYPSYYPYYELQGTSMAAPAVSGAVILLNQKFNRTFDRLPSPATTKGLLVHTAEDLNRTGPDYITGWGLVNTTAAVEYINESKDQELIQTGILSQDESQSWKVSVPENTSLNFTLVWSDYPASSGAAKALKNDLDLVVKNSSGRYYPWTLNWSIRDEKAVRTKKDERNVVERVYVPNTSSKELTVRVNGTSIPKSPQSYSLLMDSQVQVVPNLTIESPLNQSYSRIPDFNLSSSDNLSDAKFSLNGNDNYSMVKKNSSYFYNTSVSVEDGSYEAVFWANDSEGDWNSEKVSFKIDREAPNLTVRSPEKNENISGEFWINETWSSATDIEKHNYTLHNATYSLEGQLNDSVKSSNLADENYNITYNVTDAAGNFNSTEIEVTVDNTRPSLDSFNPVDDEYFDSNFSVNATWSDATSGVKIANLTLENSSIQASGELNYTVDASTLVSGEYDLTYILRDYAGNYENKTVKISVDREDPSLEILNPVNSSYVSENFSVEASYSDNLSVIAQGNYSVSNGTEQLSGSLNDTVDTSGLSEGEYNVTFKVSDNLGNFNSDYVNITLDRTSPELNLTSPSGSVSGNFSIKATYSDENPIDFANYTLENSSIQASGALNDTLNSSEYADGSYTVEANVSDLAGNFEISSNSITIDNSPPQVSSSPIQENGNISGVFDFNVSFDEASPPIDSSFRVYNSSGNQTAWLNLNYTGFNTSDLSDGEYNFSIRANDSLGNFKSENLTDVKIDNTDPEISLVEYNDTMQNGWAEDEKTVEIQCSDSGSDVRKVSVAGENSSKAPANFTLMETGENSFSFSCTDFAGNMDVVERNLRIDGEVPDLQDVSPSEGVETGRSFELVGEFDSEASESGIDEGESNLAISAGSLENVEWTNDSFSADVSGPDYSESFTISGQIEDRVGHTYDIALGYTVKAQETSSGGGGGGDGGAPATTQEMQIQEEENQTEKTSNTSNTTEKKEDPEQCAGGAAVNPEKNSCRSFSGCIPDGWESVESCSVWQDKQEAEQLLENISENEADQDLLQRAQQEFEEGNYSGAKRLASKALSSSSEKIEQSYLLPKLLLGLFLLGATAFFGYRKYQEKKLEEEIRDLSDQVLEKVDEGEIAQEKPFVDSIIQAYQAIDMGKRERAERKLKKFYREIEKEGLEISHTSR